VDKYNLTQGGIVKKLFSVATPLIMTQVLQMTYNLTDMFWLGRHSDSAVAASGTVGLFLWMAMAFMLFGRMGAEIGVSQNIGKGDLPQAKEFAQNAVLLSVVLGILLSAVVFTFHTSFVSFFGIREAHVERYAKDYLSMVSLSFPFTFLSASIMGIFNGSGNSKTAMVIGGSGFLVNMVLTPIMIFNMGLGVMGAGLATVFAQSVAAGLGLILIKVHKNRPFEKFKLFRKASVDVIKQIFKWVTPVSTESFFFTALTMLVSLLIVSFGESAMAATRVSTQIESLTWLIGGGFASALTAYTGQNFGAGKWTRINRGFKVSSGIMSFWGLIVSLILIFGGRFLVGLFVSDEVAELGAMNLRIFAICQIPQCLEGVAAGVFRGQGKTVPPSISSISSNVARVILAYVLVHFTDLGLYGVWIALALGATMRGIWIYVWYVHYSRRVPRVDVV
jgi:putative MATE family efflux protein